MYLDVTGFNTFHGNWEKFRLVRRALGYGIVPVGVPDALARGIALGKFAEGDFRGWTRDQIVQACYAEGITDPLIARGEAMWPTLKEFLDRSGDTCLDVEMEFSIPLEGKLDKHYLVGRVENLWKDQSDQQWIKEYKGTGEGKTKLYEIEKAWGIHAKRGPYAAGMQANTEILGARSLGYSPLFQVIYIEEGTPPSIIGNQAHLVPRNEHELEYTLRAFTQTCDVITMLDKNWGSEYPWAHVIHSIWDSEQRGSCNNGWCDYREVCGNRLAEMPEGFWERPEHLNILKRLRDK